MRCDRQVKFRAEHKHRPPVYLCHYHAHLYRPLWQWTVYEMSEGETMGCDVEVGFA